MTQEKPTSSSDEINRHVMKLMRISMRNNALHYFKRVDARTILMLQDLGLFKGEILSSEGTIEIQVVKDKDHPRREKLSIGPIIVYRAKEEKPKRRLLIEIPRLLLRDNVDERLAGFECIHAMVESGDLKVTPKTANILKELRESGLIGKDSLDNHTAIVISDALYDDYLVNLSGLRQNLELEPSVQESLDFYVPKVLFPELSSLDSFFLDISNPDLEKEKLDAILEELTDNASSLKDLCIRYFEKLGTLPLAPKYSLAQGVYNWVTSNAYEDVWSDVWEWANATPGPLARYHACMIFVIYPEFIPEGKLIELWLEVLEVIDFSDGGDDSNLYRDAWLFRCDLSRHYTYHLGRLLPAVNGTVITCFAWWLTEQVASLFTDKEIGFYRDNWIKPALEFSSNLWVKSSPILERSLFHYVNIGISSPFSLGLLATLGENFKVLSPEKHSDEIKLRLHNSLVSLLIKFLPFPTKTQTAPVFSFQNPMTEMVLEWSKHQPEDQAKALEQLVETNKSLEDKEGICDALRKIPELSLADQIAVGFALKSKAFTDPAFDDAIWEVMSDEKWRFEVLANVESKLLDILINAFNIIHMNNGDKYKLMLPFYLAEICERLDKGEQLRQMFFYVVHTSFSCDSYNAVDRLLRGEHRAKFVDYVKDVREILESFRDHYPPWARGKLRGLMAILKVG